MNSWRLLMVAVAVVWVAPAHALRERPFFRASRALAMGDAYTAYDVGYEAVYYNPAGVARRNKPEFKYIDLEAEASQGALSTIKDSLTSFRNLSKIVTNLYQNPGNVQAVGFSLTPQFLIRNFSIGFIARGYNEAYTPLADADVDFYAYSDLGAYAQFGFALFGGIIRIGAGMKAIDRAEINRTYTAAELASSTPSLSSQWTEGTGIGGDVGALITLPTSLQPTLGIAVQDLGNTRLNEKRFVWTSPSASTPGRPLDLRQRVNVGLAMSVKHARGVRTGLSAEMKDIANKNTKDYLGRFHAGMEVDFNKVLYLRGGVNQGRYWTAGLGLHAGGMGLEVASYGDNVAFSEGERRDARFWVGRYVLEF
ncbi:MAG: hypothetical protein JST16_04850 [Bdellovibrionales bacterium]|nr:hypothetical protein [Bdellovibrionales bacterium]